jgi:hypothetical protein
VPKPSLKRPWRPRDRLDENDIADLIITYQQGATVAFLAAAHGMSLRASSASYTPPVSAEHHSPDNRRPHQPLRIRSRSCPAFTARSAA